MLEVLSERQRRLCEACRYRDSQQTTVVLCPYSRNCPKLAALERHLDGGKKDD